MFKKSIIAGLILSLSASAQEKKCNLYPIKPMEPLHYGQLLIDRIEYIFSEDRRKTLDYEITAWYGGDYNKVWLELEGEHDTDKNKGDIEKADILYGRAFSPFWDIRGGIGYTGSYGDNGSNRSMAVIGLKGLAPYYFEIDTNLRLTTKGEIFGDFEAEYDILFTQRLAVQPRLDTTFSFSKIEEIGIGTGINNVKLSLRLRYEIKREFAPYIGISYSTLFGQTKSLAREEGEKTKYTDIFLGVRMWF